MSRTDSDSFSGSIGDTNSESLEVSASDANRVVLYIDDGTTDSAPGQYTLTIRGYSPELGRYQFHSEVTGETSRAWEFGALGSKTEIELTNTAGSSGNYDMTLESRSEE